MALTQIPAPGRREAGARRTTTRRPCPSRRGTRLAAGSALWLSLLLVTYWWVAGGGIGDLAGWTTGLRSVGRITGLSRRCCSSRRSC